MKPPAISSNQLIVASDDHYLYALDLKTGKPVWQTDLGERILVTPVAEGTNIFVGTTAGYFFQLNAADGSVGWKFKAKGGLQFDPCTDSEGIYFGSHDGNFYKINRQGQLIWAFQTGHQMTSSCTLYKDLVITTSWDYNMYGIRRDTGQAVWKVPTGQFNYGYGVVVGDSVFYGTHEMLYRIDAATGKIQIQKKAAYNTHLAAYQNFIYTQERGLTKRTLDLEIVKNVQFIPFENFIPSVVQNEIVHSDNTNHLIGFSPDLEILWKFRAKDLFWSPGVLHDGVYYIGNRDDHVYALRIPS